MTFSADAFFDSVNTTLKVEGQGAHTEFAACVKSERCDADVWIVVGHTDVVDSLVHNQRRSIARFNAVQDS